MSTPRPPPCFREAQDGADAPPEGKEKGRALLHRDLGPNTPPMPLDDALHDRQSHPGAVRLVGAVQPLEHPEELVRVAQLISICRWLQLVYEGQLVLLENAPFSTL
jgi:hypothetical protein